MRSLDEYCAAMQNAAKTIFTISWKLVMVKISEWYKVLNVISNCQRTILL